MAKLADDIEAFEILAILVLIIFIVYEIIQAGKSLGDIPGSIWDIIKQMWNKITDAFSGGGTGTLFSGSDSGNSSNPNSLPPTTTDGSGTCNAMICTGVGG